MPWKYSSKRTRGRGWLGFWALEVSMLARKSLRLASSFRPRLVRGRAELHHMAVPVPTWYETTTASPPHHCSTWTAGVRAVQRSEEHTSELQSRQYLVCRL